ncbi:MAG TPA: hypothetical protein VIV11_39890 [Kofleriaceae bacterium]
MRRAAVVIAMGAATLAACFIKPEPPGAGGDGGGPSDSSPPLTCIRDDFESSAGSACGTWGTGSGTLMRSAGELHAEITSGLDVSGCQSAKFNFTEPVALKIRLASPLMQDRVFFLVTLPGSPQASVKLEIYNGNLYLYCPVLEIQVPYLPTTHQYLRFSASTGQDMVTVFAHYSPTGASWNLIGECVHTNVSQLGAELRFAVGAGVGGAPRGAVFDDLTTTAGSCP